MTRPFGLAVRALIRDRDGRCLLLRRSARSTSSPGRWELPGGNVGPGEAFDAALVREVAQETGLAIAVERAAGATSCALPAVHVVQLVLHARVTGGQLRLSDEHDEFRWVSMSEIRTLELSEQGAQFLQALPRLVSGGP